MPRPTRRARLAGEKTESGITLIARLSLGLMVVVSGLLAWGAPDRAAAASIALTAYLLFLSSAAVGAFLGFLFGLPRARVIDQGAGPGPPDPAGTPPTGAAAAPAGPRYLVNSNLIKVSDWLTTIVVGLGLVTIGNALPSLGRLANAVSPPLGGSGYAGALGLPIIITGFLVGFILCYLWTSIRLRELFDESERSLEPVPELRELTIGDAKKEVGGTSLKLLPPEGAGDEITIRAQEPVPGTLVPPGTGVTVTI